MNPFRFGIQTCSLPSQTWKNDLKYIEKTGFSSILWTDHFEWYKLPQWDPTIAIASTAANTNSLKTGTMVYCVDYHHPVVLARSSATAQLHSQGRIEFGIGAGWMETDYIQAGIPYDKPATRIRRMEEAIKIIKSMWKGKTTFQGKYYQINDIAKTLDLGDLSPPPILVGGGGKMVLSLGGRHADIVNIIMGLSKGRIDLDFYREAVLENYEKRIEYVRKAALKAGRCFEDIELSTDTFYVEITDDPESVYSAEASKRDLKIAEVKSIPTFFIGSKEEVIEQLFEFREATGISYIILGFPSMKEIKDFGENIVKDLTGK
jgi:probable F420-dependent oxidoreductase